MNKVSKDTKWTARSIYHTLRFWLLIAFLSIVLAILSIVMRLFDSSGDKSHRVNALWGRLLCKMSGIQTEVTGLENLDPNQAQIFVANHQSYFDIFTLSGFLPVQLRWVAKESLFRIPFVGWAMTAAGYIPVDRDDKKKAYRAFLSATDTLKLGKSIVIFPEGTRSADGVLGEFKKGGHILALRSKAAMVPITLIGSGQIIKKGSYRFNPGPIRVILSPAISYEKLKAMKEEKALIEIRETISHNLQKFID